MNKDGIKTQIMNSYSLFALTIVTILSFFAAYDIFGDIYYLSTLHEQFVESEILAIVNYAGLAFCSGSLNNSICYPNHNLPEPLSSPNTYEYSTKTGQSREMWKEYTSKWQDFAGNQWDVLPSTTFRNYRCKEIFNNKYPYNDTYFAYEKCVNAACGECVNSCIWNYNYEGIPIYQYLESSEYQTSQIPGFFNCVQERNVRNAYPVISIIAYILLAVILLKEIIKTLFIFAYFFSIKAQTRTVLKISMNSPLTGIFVVCSSRFSSDILSIQDDDTSRRTLGLFLDLFTEDIPQIFIPLWFYFEVNNEFKPETIISLSGSALMLTINVGILIRNLWKDYKSVINEQVGNNKGIQMVIQSDNFKKMFYENVDLNEYTDHYFSLFLDQGIDNLQILRKITISDLKEIGIDKLGHRKTIYYAIQQINQQNGLDQVEEEHKGNVTDSDTVQ